MAYEPQVWQPFQEGGTIITADALNYMEAGIATTSAEQEELEEYCQQMDNDIRASVDASLSATVDNVNETMGEYWDVLVARDVEVQDTLREEAATEHAAIRSEMAALPHLNVAYNTFSWSQSISASTLTQLGGGSVSGDGPLTLSSNSISVPDTVKVAFLSLKGSLPVTASITGRRFMEVLEGSDSTGVRQELYVGNGVGITLIMKPGYTYSVKAYCNVAGTATATATAVSFI